MPEFQNKNLTLDKKREFQGPRQPATFEPNKTASKTAARKLWKKYKFST